jgi:hypothetical protein
LSASKLELLQAALRQLRCNVTIDGGEPFALGDQVGLDTPGKLLHVQGPWLSSGAICTRDYPHLMRRSSRRLQRGVTEDFYTRRGARWLAGRDDGGLATSSWYCDFADHRSPHDAWLDQLAIREPAEGQRRDHRTVSSPCREGCCMWRFTARGPRG